MHDSVSPAELSARLTAASAVVADFRADIDTAPVSSPPPWEPWALRLAGVLGDIIESHPVAGGSESALRDALAAIADALRMPDEDVPNEAYMEWRNQVPTAAIRVTGAIDWILRPGASIADHVRYLREMA